MTVILGGVEALSKYPYGLNAVRSALVRLENPAFSVGLEGPSQARSRPSNLYCCRNLTTELTKEVMRALLATILEK